MCRRHQSNDISIVKMTNLIKWTFDQCYSSLKFFGFNTHFTNEARLFIDDPCFDTENIEIRKMYTK